MSLLKSSDSEKPEYVNKWSISKIVKCSFMNRILTVSYKNVNEDCILIEIFLNEVLRSLESNVNSFLKFNIALKFNIELHAIYTKPNMKLFDNTSLQPKIFKTEMEESFYMEDFFQKCLIQLKNLKRRMEEFKAKEGGWTLSHLVKVDFNLNKYQPFKGASYIPLPRTVLFKRCCINVANKKDDFCFKWAIISSISGCEKQPNRTSSYNVDISSKIIKYKEFRLNFEGLSFPIEVKDVAIFEKKNHNIGINVFGYDEEKDLVIGPYYKTKNKRNHHINLLYYEGQIKQKTVGHFVWIRSMSRLMSSQLSGSNNRVEVCDICLQYFPKDSKDCCQKLQHVLFHDKCPLEFKNSVKVVNVPFVMYANVEKFPQNTEVVNPLSFVLTYFIKCDYDDDLNKWCIFKGINAPREFAESLIKDAKFYYKNYSTVVKPKIALTDDEHLEYQNNFTCCLCSTKVTEKVKVKLHCRLTGKYKGPAHHACALNYRIPKKFPVIFQNLSINDCSLLIKELSEIDEDPINARTLNNESYISFEKDIKIDTGKLELRFLNFSRFLSCGLDNVVKYMSSTDLKLLKSTYPDENKFELVTKKILFPYKSLRSVEQLGETCFPWISSFDDPITNEKCLAEDYRQARNFWSVFECKNLEDYLSVYLKIKVLLLADVFEHFRLVSRNAYNLDPCHYYSAAEFSWDAMLKITGIKLNLPTDKEMISFLKKGMRAGISKCFQKRSVANNKYLRDYDDKLPSKYLMCFHGNDLYGRVMAEHLPEGNFEWKTDIDFSWESTPNDSEIGFILEVDLEYPSDIFETHQNFPFCSENLNSLETDEKSLVLSLSSKHNYIIYYKNLQQCLKHGLKLKKIHRILQFKQSDWLKRYVILNKTSGNIKNPFEVKVLQLMNTAIYEKIMEKSEKRMKIIKKWESDGRKLGARALISKPEFSSVHIFDENLVAVELNANVYNHVPVYLELIISELIKLKMYSFHYEYLLPKYEANSHLNYIDTDTLIYTITTDDVYKDIKNDICSMITRTASNNSQLLFRTLGIVKDANDGVVLKEFIGIRPKLYAFKSEVMQEKEEDGALKNNSFTCRSLTECTSFLQKNKIYSDNFNSFKSKLYQRYAVLFNKGLLLNYSADTSNILSDELIAKLTCVYYRGPFAKAKNYLQNMMDID